MSKEKEKDRIKCGKCSCEFYAKTSTGEERVSCPMCDFGPQHESVNQSRKTILLD